jgi:hypothetical protein
MHDKSVKLILKEEGSKDGVERVIMHWSLSD